MNCKQTKQMNSPEMVESLVEENYGLIFYVIKTFLKSGAIERRDYDDAIWYATDGLLKAAQSFDASRGFSFSTYACTSIRNSVISLIRDKRKHLQYHQLVLGQVAVLQHSIFHFLLYYYLIFLPHNKCWFSYCILIPQTPVCCVLFLKPL